MMPPFRLGNLHTRRIVMSSLSETRKILLACLVAVIGLPVVSSADQTAAKPATWEPGKGMSDTVEKRATVTAIDTAKRTVTLKGDQGEFEVDVGPEVKNFDKLKVGDVVVATYTQAIAARIAAPGEATPGVKESVTGNPADKGHASVGREVTASVKVEAVDLKANTVTLSGPSGEKETVEVKNPKVQERLKTLKPGDVVVVTYTESLALRLDKVAGN
jgi:hypothetical protein